MKHDILAGMKRLRISKQTIGELIRKEQAGELKLLGDKEKLTQQSRTAIERMQQGNPGFTCKKCGRWYRPEPYQWIFHHLCDICFAAFDIQKMAGRTALLVENRRVHYFEDSDQWIQQQTN
jgi:hypothetical protein